MEFDHGQGSIDPEQATSDGARSQGTGPYSTDRSSRGTLSRLFCTYTFQIDKLRNRASQACKSRAKVLSFAGT